MATPRGEVGSLRHGGFPDGVAVENGYVTMPDLPGIGFEGKSDLYQKNERDCGLECSRPKPRVEFARWFDNFLGRARRWPIADREREVSIKERKDLSMKRRTLSSLSAFV